MTTAAILQILVRASTATATAALMRTDAQLKKTTASAAGTSAAMKQMDQAAKYAAGAVGVGLAVALYKGVKAGADFEKQMDSVGAVANANAKQMKALEKQALSLGQKTQYSALEVAAAQEELVKGGLKLKDILGGALPASLSLAAAGQMELADASTTTVNAMKLFGLQGKEAMNVADMLATAANKTTADVSDFAMALQQGGSAAKAAGYTLNDTITVLEALAEAGIKNSDAGTSMKTAFLQLLAPTEKQQQLAEKLNLELVDQQGNLKGAAGLSKELHGALDGMSNAQQAANLKLLAGTDGFRTLNALLSASPDKFREFANANRESGTANEVAKEKTDNLSGSVEQLKGAFQTLQIKLSKDLNPTIRDTVDWLTEALNKLSKVGPGAAWGKTIMTAQDLLFRDLNKLTDDQLYEQVALWDAGGKTITKHQVTHWLALNKISAEGADRLFRMIDRFTQNSKDAFAILSGYMRGTVSDGMKIFSTKTAGFLREWSNKGQDSIKELQKALRALDDGFEKSGERTQKATVKMADAGEKMAKSLKGTTQAVTGSFSSMVNATGDGLRIMGKNVNDALGGFGVKKVSFSIAKVGNSAAGFQKGGAIVPGQGDGDKVPAMLEPGEVVINKRAVQAMGGPNRVNSINHKIPRFAQGGVIQQALGPYSIPPIAYDPNHAGGNSHLHLDFYTKAQALSYGHKMQGMGWTIGEYTGSNPYGFGPVTTQHQSPAHYDGTGFDANTPQDETKSQVAAIARLLNGGKISGAVAERIARLVLKGPNGPLKDMGQSALDKVRAAANKFIASKAPNGEVGVGGTPLKGLPKALQKYNQVYAQSSGFGDGYAMPFNAVAALGEWAGAPGVSMARTAIGESQLEPGAVGFDPGGTRGLGLWMITTGYNDALISKLGGESKMRNPVLNAQAMNSIFDSQGIGAWYSQTADSSNTHYNGPLLHQMGGIVQKFAKGGEAKPQHGSVSGGKPDRAWKRFTKARRIAQRLKGILGEGGAVAKIDETIGLAERDASSDFGPGGSDLTADELRRQVRLNEHLVTMLVKARRLSRAGLDFLDFPKGMSTTAIGKTQLKNLKGTFGSYLTDLTGVTGKGGRIAEAIFHGKELGNTSIGGDNSAQIADLTALLNAANARYAVSQAQYGVFDGFRANGGRIAPGKWAVTGERGPEVVHGPASVTPISARPSLTIEELNIHGDGRVTMKYGGKEFEAAVRRVTRTDSRKGGRVLPGRAGS